MFSTEKPLRDESSFIVGVYALTIIVGIIISVAVDQNNPMKWLLILFTPISIAMGLLFHNILVAIYNLIIILGVTTKRLLSRIAQ